MNYLYPLTFHYKEKSFHNDDKEEKIASFYIKAATRKLAKTGNKNVNKSLPFATKSMRKSEVEEKTRGRKGNRR